jgi:hypothetical protein
MDQPGIESSVLAAQRLSQSKKSCTGRRTIPLADGGTVLLLESGGQMSLVAIIESAIKPKRPMSEDMGAGWRLVNQWPSTKLTGIFSQLLKCITLQYSRRPCLIDSGADPAAPKKSARWWQALTWPDSATLAGQAAGADCRCECQCFK